MRQIDQATLHNTMIYKRMMRVILLLAVASISALFSACSSMQITAQPGQNVVFNHGHQVVVSSKKSSLVAVEGLGASNQNRGRAVFCITCINRTKSPIDIGLENITAKNAAGRPVRIYSDEDLKREARIAATMQAIAVGMNAGASAFAASQPSYTSYSGSYSGTANYNAYTPYGRPVGSIQGYQSGNVYGSATTYNPAQAAIANQAIQQNTAMQMGGIQGQLASSLAQATDVLARTTVPPGGTISGLIIARKSAVTDFTVNLAGEGHSANFEVK